MERDDGANGRKNGAAVAVPIVERFRVGGDRNLAYLIVDPTTQDAAVIDPSFSPGAIVDRAEEAGYRIRYAFCTHGHFDHSNGNDEFAARTKIRPAGFGEVESTTRRRAVDGAVFPLGRHLVRVLHTPGHTADSICLWVGDALFTGDTLFVGKIGGTDEEEGSRREYASLHEKLLALPDGTRVFPGHDYGVTPESTIGRERETNPFLLCPDFESFLDLKRNWLEYKRQHGIA